MTRVRATGYAALTAVEVIYILHANLPMLWPPPCRRFVLDACVFISPVYAWLWVALAALLVLSAIAILLRKKAGEAAAFIGQALLLPPFVRDIVDNVGSFLFTGSGYSGVDPSYRDLAFILLALSVVIGPSFTLLLLMRTRPAAENRRAARVAAVLLSVQLAALIAVAVIVFRATYQDCEHNGPGTPVIDGVPGCPDFADLDVGSLVATIVPSAAVLFVVCAGVWRGRSWALAGAIVWQLLLAVALAAMGVALWSDQSQNAWYDHFPGWTSPRYLAYALIFLVPAPTLAALLAARTTQFHGVGRASRSS
jgi:hypothetical protein